MKMKHPLIGLGVWISFSILIHTQTVHNVQVKNFSFTPTLDTITAGDVVRWTNTGGAHNVVADDNSFTSGPVSSSAWVYEHTFNSPGTNPYYCAQHGGPGGVGMSGVIVVRTATDIKDKNIPLDKFSLKQNYPNPFNPSTSIQYTIGIKQFVSLKVFNILGNEVAALVNEEKPAGTYEVTFNAKNFPSGVYLYKLQTGPSTGSGQVFIDTKKMILLK
jgi:plastocyanin